MHDLTLVLSYVLGGICVYAAVTHGAVGWRRPRDAVQLVFALLCLSIAGLVVASSIAARAGEPVAFLAANRWSVSFGTLTYLAELWFIALFTGIRPVRLLYALSGVFVAILAINSFGPQSIQYESLQELKAFDLPWGETINLGLGKPSIWFQIGTLALAIAMIFILYASIRYHREHRNLLALAMMIAVLIGAAGTL